MITIKVISGESIYILPNKIDELQNPNLTTIRQGVECIYKDLVKEIPGHDFKVTWNDNAPSIQFFSKTVPKNIIKKIIYENHGIEII